MDNTKQYSWKEWILIPQNKELYQKDQLSALKLFQLEVVRRGDIKKWEEKRMSNSNKNKKLVNERAVLSISKRDIEKKVKDFVYDNSPIFSSGIQSAASKQKVIDKNKAKMSWSKDREDIIKELLPFVIDLYKKHLAPIIIRERAFISEVDGVVNRELNLRVSTLLKSELGQLKIGSPQHQFAVMHILIGALKHAKFNLQAKKVPILFKGAKFDSNLTGEEWASSVLKTIRGYEAIGVKIAKLAENNGVDIVSAIGFYVSMTIGRPIGEKIQNLVEYNLTLGDFIRENIRFKNGEVFLKKVSKANY